MFLCWMKACPFQLSLCLFCFCPSSSPPPPLHLTPDFYWPTATLNYHGWKEKQIRRAWNSEADSPSLTVQKENNSNEHSLLPSVDGLDRVWVARGITREHGVFWMHDKHRISQQTLVYRDTYTVLFMVLSAGPEVPGNALHDYSPLNSTSAPRRLCSTSEQWTRCEKLLQCLCCSNSWKSLEMLNRICYL